jgi:hypothetical protein
MDTAVIVMFAVAVLAAPSRSRTGHATKNGSTIRSCGERHAAGCPAARTLLTKTEMEREAHVRAERVTADMEGRCAKSSSYFYVPEIAANLRRALRSSNVLKGTSVWVSVQRRWVSIQGCAKTKSKKAALEAIARRIPDVDNVFVDLRLDPKKPPPYPVLQTISK